MKFYAPVEISENRRRTPEGYLLCEGVKLARTGVLLYGPGEVPVEVGPDGVVHIERSEAEVFRPESLASINGKPIVDDHPPEDVAPGNWKKHSGGVLLNPRRGEGVDDMFVLGDMLLTDADAIAAVDQGKVQISLGYNAEYEQFEPGRGRQRNIVVNHVALVDKGRCGPSCAIGDSAPMSKPRTFRELLNALVSTKDAAALAKVLDEDMGEAGGGRTDGLGGMTLNIHTGSVGKTPDEKGEEDPTEARFKKMEDSIADCAKMIKDALGTKDAKTGDDDGENTDDGKTGDAAFEADRKRVVAAAEILVPGFKVPTLDAKADPKAARERLCTCQRRALDEAYRTAPGKLAIDPFLGDAGSDFDTLPLRTIDVAFFGASAIIAQRNNSPLFATFGQGNNTNDAPVNPISAMNKANAEFWAKRSGAAA